MSKQHIAVVGGKTLVAAPEVFRKLATARAEEASQRRAHARELIARAKAELDAADKLMADAHQFVKISW